MEREDPSVDPEADAILITVKDIEEAHLKDLLPTSTGGQAVIPPHIVITSAPDRDGPAAALSLGAADAMSAPVHLPELCARLHARIREKLEAARGAQWEELRDAAAAVMKPGLDPEELVLALVRRLARSFDLAHCSFVSVAPGGESVRVIAEVQRPSYEPEHLELDRHPEIAEAIRTRRIVTTALPTSDSAEAPRTLVVLPVEGDSRVAAALLLGTREAHRRLSPLQLEFAAGLARTAAAALEQNERVPVNGGTANDRASDGPDIR